MTRAFSTTALALAALLAACGGAAAQTSGPRSALRAAVDEYRRGHLAEAERDLRSLAGQDNEAAAWLAVVLLARNDSSPEAIELLQRAAAAGNAEAEHNLGLQYAIGRGVKLDESHAAQLFAQAAQQGHARAAVNLGTFYAQGRGVPRDPAKARALYMQAANAGDAYGQFAFARLLEGEGRFAEAADLYRKAADQGHLGASLRYGRLLADGNGISRDPREAQKRLRHAADGGLPEAALALGDLLAQLAGRGELPRTAETATQIVECYRRAADAGLPAAQFKLGNAFFAGTGVGRDFAQAERWYRRAAQQGHAEAQYTLGIWLSGGVGGKTDLIEGYAWLVLAERGGYSDAGLVRQKAAEKLTAAQVAQADSVARGFVLRPERKIGEVDNLPLKPPQS